MYFSFNRSPMTDLKLLTKNNLSGLINGISVTDWYSFSHNYCVFLRSSKMFNCKIIFETFLFFCDTFCTNRDSAHQNYILLHWSQQCVKRKKLKNHLKIKFYSHWLDTISSNHRKIWLDLLKQKLLSYHSSGHKLSSAT